MHIPVHVAWTTTVVSVCCGWSPFTGTLYWTCIHVAFLRKYRDPTDHMLHSDLSCTHRIVLFSWQPGSTCRLIELKLLLLSDLAKNHGGWDEKVHYLESDLGFVHQLYIQLICPALLNLKQAYNFLHESFLFSCGEGRSTGVSSFEQIHYFQ